MHRPALVALLCSAALPLTAQEALSIATGESDARIEALQNLLT